MGACLNWMIRHAELDATMRPVRVASGKSGSTRPLPQRVRSMEDATLSSIPQHRRVLFEDGIHILLLSPLSERRIGIH